MERMDLDMQHQKDSLTPLVAVYMISYNHAPFVAQALQSVIDQAVDFAIHIYIGDDASKDDTQKIIAEFQERYPKLITATLRATNVGARENARDILEQAWNSGAKYVAFLEGDDYWSSNTKLAKQTKWMEENEELGLTFHKTAILNVEGQFLESDLNPWTSARTFTIEDFARRNFVHTPSILLRISAFPGWPSWTPTVIAGDYLIAALVARDHKLGYLPDEMAVYRIHSGGIWTAATRTYQTLHWINLLDNLRNEGFPETVRQVWLEDIEEKLHPIIVELYYSDRKKFTEVMTNLGHRYPGVSKEWLLNRYPSIVSNFENSIWVRMGKKINGIKSKLFGKSK